MSRRTVILAGFEFGLRWPATAPVAAAPQPPPADGASAARDASPERAGT